LARFENRKGIGLPRLLVLTDTSRGYNLTKQMALWPAGAAFIERTYGDDVSVLLKTEAFHLATCTQKRARNQHLDGVHWPNKQLRHRRRSHVVGLLETTSAHSGLEIAKARRSGIKNVLVSCVFTSQSASAGKPIGPIRLAILCRRFPELTIYALGGIDFKTSKRLTHTGVYGLAIVSWAR
jgi:thiamine-phosphate pyrophosphorylase